MLNFAEQTGRKRPTSVRSFLMRIDYIEIDKVRPNHPYLKNRIRSMFRWRTLERLFSRRFIQRRIQRKQRNFKLTTGGLIELQTQVIWRSSFHPKMTTINLIDRAYSRAMTLKGSPQILDRGCEVAQQDAAGHACSSPAGSRI
jgi:hypothetical protein